MKSGQAVLEMVVAFLVLTVAVVALTQIVTKSTANSTYSRQQSQATALATAAVEWIRSQRDQLGWSAFSQLAGTYCLNTLAWVAGACGTQVIDQTEFTRQAQVTGSDTRRQVRVTVNWPAGDRAAQVSRTIVLTKY